MRRRATPSSKLLFDAGFSGVIQTFWSTNEPGVFKVRGTPECIKFRRQVRRFGVAAPGARLVRAQRERRLGVLAEQAGDMPAALLHYRAALATHAGVGST